jgi:hypothetical protein
MRRHARVSARRNARACLQLADVIREDLSPLRSRTREFGLCEYVVEDAEIAGVPLLADLCDALKRSATPGEITTPA